MRIYKRGNIYWTEFIVDNKRYQMSTKTKDKKLAEEIAAALQSDVVRILGSSSLGYLNML